MASGENLLAPRSAITPELGRRVRQDRIARGWSQEKLARTVGVTRRTIIRLEQGSHRPTSHLVHALERALDLARLVPGWTEPADPNLPSYGPRARGVRIAGGLTLAQVSRAAGVSPATLSRFERELGETPRLAGPWGTAGEGVVNEGLAVALGFSGCRAMNDYCMSRDRSSISVSPAS